MTSPKMIRYLEGVQDKIDRTGWAIQGVFDPNGDVEKCFAYTVGLDPEYVITGMDPGQAAGLLNSITATILVEGGVPPADRTVRTDLLTNATPVRFVVVPSAAAARALRVAAYWRRWKDRSPTFEAVQVLWPDENGILPDVDGYAARQFPQRILGA